MEYEADGGVGMRGFLAVPDGVGLRPGVLVAHEAPGLDDTHRERAVRLAELGYVAFALDAHGGGRFDLESDEVRGRVGAIMGDPDRGRGIAQAGLQELLAEARTDPSRVAAIGYCFGGYLVLELARSGARVRATVGFHPGMQSARPEDAENITGKVLICVGADDPYCTAEHRAAFEAEMSAAGVDWRMHLYGGIEHSFTHPRADASGIPGLAYDPPTAERAWNEMLALFGEALT